MSLRLVANRSARLGALAILLLGTGRSAELKQETLAAWNSYVAQENSDVKQRAAQEEGFFWTDADPKRMERVRAGEVVVEPVGEHNPLHVPSGLIHHWIAAVFIPDGTIEDVLAITRDYSHYKDYFKPGVADAATISKSDTKDEFTIRFVNPSVLSKTSLQGNYISEFVHVSANRFYSTSVTTSMCEIKNFGCPNEKQTPPNQGSGYIWRLYSTARMENRDGGVLLEMEAVALSRDIPAGLRWFVDPIVRRVSRESIEKSLTETYAAVRQHVESCPVQTSRSVSRANPIMEAGICAHADHSDIRPQGFASNPGR